MFHVLYNFPLPKSSIKIPSIRPGRIHGQRATLMDLYSGGFYTGGLMHRRNNTSIITFLSFFQYKARILAYFTSARCEICSKLIIKTPGYVERRVNDKVNNKDNVDIVLASLLLTLSTFHFVLQCFCN